VGMGMGRKGNTSTALELQGSLATNILLSMYIVGNILML
jgi:hypothetical protein